MSQYFADVIVDITSEKLDRVFQYRIPEALSDKVRIGTRVQIPFGGGNRSVTGYVVSFSESPGFDPEKIKEIAAVPKEGLTVETKLIALAAWIRETYGSTMNQALKTVMPVKVKKKSREKKRFRLLADQEQASLLLEQYNKKNSKARARLLEALMKQGSLEWEAVTKDLKVPSSAWKPMEQQGILRVEGEIRYRNPLEHLDPEMQQGQLPSLDEEQHLVCEGIRAEWKSGNRPVLLQGVTGSGKTFVYIELIQGILEQGKDCIVLIPEIALTWQTVNRFYQRFGEQVTVLHSRMTPAERSDQFERVKKRQVRIVIGPRSALFTPFSNLGLIIVDEEQEHTYQSEVTPRYDARDTAIQRAKLEGAHVLLGSATPSVESSWRCRRGSYARFLLESRYGAAVLPEVTVTDMREELKAGNRSILGRDLHKKIQERLQKKEQVLLFLNRRGHTGFISCRSCGTVIKCPHCDVSLTYHNNGRLICHYCGYTREKTERCPECGSPYIGGFRAGTQQVEQLVQREFPSARVLRMDADSTRGKDGYEKILKAFAAGEADILIGTQMIIKGHDFPDVTLVGVLAADASLFAEDYRASEQTYQLLVQAVGRAGRGVKPGEAVIQTYHPEHSCIQAAIVQDYDAFFEEEIAARELMGYPPVSGMLAVHASCSREEQLDLAMEYIRKFLERIARGGTTRIIGPAPERVAKVQDQYRRVLYVREKNRNRLLRLRSTLEKYIEINPGFNLVQIQFEVISVGAGGISAGNES
ncbi:MAG: primosomal protein N' [Lachnospiraceae bacterium]|nr:primosomal protein N' [Lachnospiraceae bacterium]